MYSVKTNLKKQTIEIRHEGIHIANVINIKDYNSQEEALEAAHKSAKELSH